jgi:hypothetical protein
MSQDQENGGTNGQHAADVMEVEPKRRAPRLNERILSSLSRRSVAAHPWHDLEIGEPLPLTCSGRGDRYVARYNNRRLRLRSSLLCRS